MKKFLNDNFLLDNKHSEELYYDFAKNMPIIDYHNHLPPKEIAENRQFDNLSQIWLNDDHYKWRAMRTYGIDEKFITGNVSDKDKFLKWAETVPQTLRNPLYHWTHLELRRYFHIDDLLNPTSAVAIYKETSEKLKSSNFRVLGLLNKMNVEIVCTTDDPLDDLKFHKQNSSDISVLPTFRPDKAMAFEDIKTYKKYLKKLEAVSNIEIDSYQSFLLAIQSRHDYFHEQGCRLSDHGLETIPFTNFTEKEINKIYQKLLVSSSLNEKEITKIKAAVLLEISKMNHSKGWTQQFHLGPLRNTNYRMFKKLGSDSGFDSIGDYPQAQTMASFFNALDKTNQLAKTIIYNLNPSENEVFASMIGNYNDGSIKGKMQFGSGWWYSDQLDGMEKQLNALSNIGLLSCFIGMLTDSRSFLSFPRHEYFRRLLCNLFGKDIERGFIPNDKKLIGTMIQNICYNNAKEYFNF